MGGARHVHLVLENDHNAARYLARQPDGRPRWYAAQWNDDVHHALHTLLTDEQGGYYADYADEPSRCLGRALSEGFAYQGEPSAYRHGERRGEPSAHLPPTAFVSFLQNHDQVGNRAFGERITTLAPPEAVRAAVAVMLLAPSPPLLFMGEEWAAPQPFLFFCDFEPGLAPRVTEGRRQEFATFPEFRDARTRAHIPDPGSPETFARSVLNWADLGVAEHRAWLELYRELLGLRHREIVPRLAGLAGHAGTFERIAARGLRAHWRLGDGAHLTLLANMGPDVARGFATAPAGRLVHATDSELALGLVRQELGAWSVAWFLDDSGDAASR